MTLSIRDATHVAFDPFVPERLLRIGATNVVRASDCLLVGPSHGDPFEHARARENWWGSPEKRDQLYLPEIRWQPPVILWVSANVLQRVNLWRTCKWLRRLGIAAQDLIVVDLDAVPPRSTPEEPMPPWDCTSSVADHPDEVLSEHLSHARPISRARYDGAIGLWDTFIDENPLPFVQSCLRGVEGFPELGPLWAFLSRLFPRRAQDGTLRLSRFDDVLLYTLSSEWQTPVKVFVHDSAAGIELRQLASCTGDLFVERRLAQWARHGESPPIERTDGPRPGSAMLSSAYRITDRGIRLRESGLEQLSAGPALPIAGTEAYGAPWILLDDARLDRL